MVDLLPIFAQYSDPSPAEAFGLALGMLFASLAIPLTILFVVYVLPYWILYTRAGQPGIAALIPIYNIWVYCKIAGRNPVTYFLVTLGGLVALGVLPLLVEVFTLFLSFGILGSLTSWAISIGLAVLWMVVSWDFAIVFNAKPVVAMVYVLVPWLGVFILLFGDHHYCGPFYKTNERIMMKVPWVLAEVGYTVYGHGAPTGHYGAQPMPYGAQSLPQPVHPMPHTSQPAYGAPAGPAHANAGVYPPSAPSAHPGQYDPTRPSTSHRASLVGDWTIVQDATPQPSPTTPPLSPFEAAPKAPASPQATEPVSSPFAPPEARPNPGSPSTPNHAPASGQTPGAIPPFAPNPPGHSPSNLDIGLPPFDPPA